MRNFIAIALAILVFSACSNEQQIQENLILTPLQITSIGESHNEFIQTSIQNLKAQNQSNFDWNGINSEQDLFDVYIDTYPNKELHSYQEVAEWLLNSLEGFNINEYSQNFQDQNVVNVYNMVLNASLMSNITSFDDYKIFIENTNTHIESNFTGFDKEFLLVTNSVALNSAYLWLSKDKGGLGQMDDLKEMYSSFEDQNSMTRNDCWDEAIAADLTAAAGYFMGVGFGWIIPGVNVAIAKAVAFSSGFASAMAGLRCAMGGGNEEDGPVPLGDGW